MATETIRIIIETRGAAGLERSVRRSAAAARSAQRSFSDLRGVLLGLGAAAAVRDLIRLTDSVTNLQNRLRTIAPTQNAVNKLFDQLANTANDTRSSLDSTVTLYSRLQRSSEGLGLATQELLDLTKGINQAFKVFGNTSAEAEASVIQFSQGLAAGALRGDELRSVLEQAPRLAKAIADGLSEIGELGDVSIGSLRKLGKEGVLTPDRIVRALKTQLATLSAEFSGTLPTIEDGFTRIRTEFQKLIRDFNNGTGFSQVLTNVLLSVANNLENIVRVLAGGAIAAGISLIVLAVNALTAAIARNPLGALLTLVTIGIGQLVAFQDQIFLIEGSIANLGDVTQATVEVLVDRFSRFFSYISAVASSAFEPLTAQIFGISENVDITFSSVISAVGSGVKTFLGLVGGLAAALTTTFLSIPEIIKQAFLQVFQAILDGFTTFINSISRGINNVASVVGLDRLLGEIESQQIKIGDGFAGVGEDIEDSFVRGFGAATGIVDDFVANAQNGVERLGSDIKARAEELVKIREDERKAREEANKALLPGALNAGTPRSRLSDADGAKGKGKTFQDVLKDLKEENRLLKLNNDERERETILSGLIDKIKKGGVTGAQKEQLRLLVEENIERERLNDLIEELKPPQEELLQRQKDLNTLLAEGSITGKQYSDAIIEINGELGLLANTVEGGLAAAFRDLNNEQSKFAEKISNEVTGTVDGFADQLTNFITGSKVDFEAWSRDVVASITKVIIKQQLLNAIVGESSAGGGGGSLFGGGGGSGGGDIFGSIISGIGSLFGPSTGLGLQTGGSILVGGRPGIDQNVLSLNGQNVARVSRGETIDVSPMGQSSGQSRPINVIYNINTPNADSFRRSQDQILTRTSAQLRRSSSRNG